MRIAVIIGGVRGIGKAISSTLAQNKYCIVTLSRSQIKAGCHFLLRKNTYSVWYYRPSILNSKLRLQRVNTEIWFTHHIFHK